MARKKKTRRLVFLSHSSRDAYWVHHLSGQLQACGAEVFLDAEKIEAGADFEAEILQYLRRADEMLLYATPWALESRYVWSELGIAWDRGIPIVVVLQGLTVAEFQSQPHVPVYLKKRDIITINEIEKFLEQFRRRATSPPPE